MTTIQALPTELVQRLTPAHPDLGSLRDLRFPHIRSSNKAPRDAFVPQVDQMKVLDGLPAASFVKPMLTILAKEQNLVVVGETGSGKSTVLPLFASAACPETDIYCAVPRIFAAERLATWLSEVCQQPVGGRVGFHTGVSKCVSSDTRLTFCTTGVAEMRELLGQNQRKRIVFLDEAHERNIDQDMLLAFLRQEAKKNPDLKIVVMSATIQSQEFSHYLGGCEVLNIKGRNFSIVQEVPEATLAEDVIKFVQRGLNIQIGLAGKLEIEVAMGEIEHALSKAGLHAIILPLHKDVPSAQQQECFKHQGKPRIILATNIAETSLTIPDLHVVIDTGLRRRVYLNNGVQCLGTVYATQFEAMQLRGRVGRTQPGIWVDRCDMAFDQRPLAPPPEILRLQPTNAFLKFVALQNMDPRNMKLLDDPGRHVWDASEQEGKRLGLTDSAVEATELGQTIARLPISVNLGRMLVSARQQGALKEAIFVAAAVEVNGLQDRDNSAWRNLVDKHNDSNPEVSSELMVQLLLFKKGIEIHAAGNNESDYFKAGISPRNFTKALEHADELIRRVRLFGWDEIDRPSRGKNIEYSLVQAFIEGFPDSIFVKHGRFYLGLDGEKRELHGDAVAVAGSQFIAGIPWDFNRNVEGTGGQPKHFINFASVVSEGTAHKHPYVLELLRPKKVKARERATVMRAPICRIQSRINRGFSRR